MGMTDDEAKIVAEIAMTADDRCPMCAADLVERLSDAFPSHSGIFAMVYDTEFGQPPNIRTVT
jgi:hypothetical protein